VIVVDLGGGTFDVSVLTHEEGVFEVRATSGDTHLGGEDFDQRIVDYMLKQHKKKTGKDCSKDKRAIVRLRLEAERAKRVLSSSRSSRIEIESFCDGSDLSEPLTRFKFEELNEDLFKRCLPIVQRVIDDSGVTKTQINEVVLSGGSMRITKVQQMLKEFFNGKEMLYMDLQETVAYGAAVQGGILSGEGGSQTKDILFLDVTPLALGIAVKGGVMSTIIKKNSVIPNKHSETFTTVYDNQPSVSVMVYEGHGSKTKDNNLLGEFEMTGFPHVKAGVPKIEVTFHLDINGILVVAAEDKENGNRQSLTITNDKGRLSRADIDRMAKEAELHASADARAAFESFLSHADSVKAGAERAGGDSSATGSKAPAIEALIEQARRWLEYNPSASK
jgi:endoplasmic reticulum chaperone BiP